jgi:GH15 family glucan-1,4-alpha-glucosidase
MPLPIEDYAILGDTHTVALVGRDGSLDWLCIPRFDSGACFAALLGDTRHGRWSLAPAGEVRQVRRRYRGETLVLETEFETEDGIVRLIDFMPPRERHVQVVRIVEGVQGQVPVRLELCPRFDYGVDIPWVRKTHDVLTYVAGPDALALRTPVDTHQADDVTTAEFTVGPGERVPFVLSGFASWQPVPSARDAEAALTTTIKFWEQWAARCTYRGDWREPVIRSLMVLKALTYAPTGGVVAAATTSLPEQLGGVRNWDYRYCWLRDASLTLNALTAGGYHAEALAFRDWLLRAAAGHPPQLQIMYGLAGERRLLEFTADWLPGYEGSAPVRIGNAAAEQFQLDVYGEVLGGAHHGRQHLNGTGAHPQEDAWELQRALLEHLETVWTLPDEGIWEVRGPRRHFTHSKVMAWRAFDCGISAVEDFGLPGPAERWRSIRDAIHSQVCDQGFDPVRNTFTQSYGSPLIDSSLLWIPLSGFLPPEDPRVQGTVAAIEKELLVDGFLLRYQTDGAGEGAIDGLPGREGAFLVCTFWLAQVYAQMGRSDDARELFERLLGLRNDLGLLSEEYDPVAGRLIGNFPQAFSHIGLINAAVQLSSAKHAAPSVPVRS